MSTDKKLSEFFENDVPAYASYDNLRKISNIYDGLKVSMRKIIFTMLDKYPGKDKTKTDTVANITAAYTCYIHGAANLCGVCNTMAQSFVGANNYPLLSGNSSGFGTRINPDCAAPRYSSIAISPIAKQLFNDDDMAILEKQYFEGSYIEPKYLIPIFPVLFLNGSDGLSTGFCQTIYPRDPKEVIKYIENKITGSKKRVNLKPWFRGHLGKVEFNKDTGRNESFGVIIKNNMTSYTITELPIGTSYSKYIELLNALCDKGVIADYDDLCDTKTDTIKFDIKTTREFTRKYEDDDRSLYEAFKLIKSLPETLCCIDEYNRVREFTSIEEILDAYIAIRLDAYQKRKDYLLNNFKDKLALAKSKYAFCNGVIKEEIKIAKVKKADIIKQFIFVDDIIEINNSYDYLLNMPMHSISYEKINELKEQVAELKKKIAEIKAQSIEDMWLVDLKDFSKEIEK